MLSSKKLNYLKLGFMLLLVCLVIGMASTVFGTTITQIDVSEVKSDGTVDVTATLDGVVEGQQVTILVTDYRENDKTQAIKYIDQTGTITEDKKVNFRFKMRNIDVAEQTTFKLTIGGTEVSSPKAEGLFKPAIVNNVWLEGPKAVKASDLASGIDYTIKYADKNGRLIYSLSDEHTVEWSVVAKDSDGSTITADPLSVSDGKVSGNGEGVASYVVTATVTAGSNTKTASMTVAVISGDMAQAPAFNAGDVKVGDTAISELGTTERGNSLYVKKPVVTSDLTLSLPAAANVPDGAVIKYRVKAYNLTTNTALATQVFDDPTSISFAGLEPGRYRIVYEVLQNDVVISEKVFYVGVADQNQTILGRSGDTSADSVFKIEGETGLDAASDTYVSVTTGADSMTIKVNNAPANTKFKYYMILKSDSTLPEAERKEKWVVLSDWTGNEITVAKPPVGEYMISVYARNDYSGEYVDAFRIITVDVK